MSTATATRRFVSTIDRLSRDVGVGTLQGSVVVDQVYARYQHEGLDFKHPQGGQAKYLEQPLFTGIRQFMGTLADAVLDGELNQAMTKNVEDLSRAVYAKAPLEFGDLKASPHPTVVDDGATVYDRAPMMRRLTEEELRIKGHLRSLGF